MARRLHRVADGGQKGVYVTTQRNSASLRWAILATYCAIIGFGALAILLDFRRIGGDGPTYMATALSLLAHHHSAIGADAIAYAAEVSRNQPGVMLKGLDGQLHAVHFWGYPLMASPLVAITKATGILRGQEFFLLNIGIALVMLGMTLRLAKDRGEALLAFALVLFPSIALYLRWSGPEVLSTTTLIAAITCLRAERFGWAVFLTAVSGLQNPTVNLFQLINGLWFLLATPRERLWPSILAMIPRLLPAVAITALPFIWSLTTFGALNPVGKAGYADLSYATWPKLISLYTDLNEGFPVVGIVLFLCIVMLATLRLRDRREGGGWFRIHDILLPAAMLITLPVIVQLNWNPGTFVYLRYWTWGIVPIAFWVAIELHGRGSRGALVAVLAASLIHGLLLFWNNAHYDGGPPRHQPWVRALWSVAPGLYTPEPEIYLERTIGNTEPPEPRQWAAWSAAPGVISKISISSELEPEARRAVDDACRVFGFAGTSALLPVIARMSHPNTGIAIAFLQTPIACGAPLPGHSRRAGNAMGIVESSPQHHM